MQDLNDSEFDGAVASGTVLVDFSAEWCGPCKAMMPTINRLATEYADRLKIYTVDIDKEPSLAARNGVMSVPTFLLYHEGKSVERIVGAVSEKELKKRIDSYAGVAR